MSPCFPANATLYVVGDFHADVPAVVDMIDKVGRRKLSLATHAESAWN